MSRDMTKAYEDYEERQSAYYSKRRAIRDSGLDPDALERDYMEYKQSKRILESLSFHKLIVQKYESSDKKKWEDF
jgi:hypothetical protein